MLLDPVFVDRAVPVIILWRRWIILDDRRKPDCSDAEVAQIIQMISNATKIPTVIRARFRPIVGSWQAGNFVVAGVTVSKPVWHNEIDHVVLRKPLKLSLERRPSR